MGQITNGIDKIEVGATGAGGTMGTSLSILGYTNIDSAALTEEDGTTNDFNVEEIDTPLLSRTTPGKTSLTFQLADPDLDAFLAVFGGTITGTGANAVWNAPRIRAQKEVSVKITPQIGYVIQIARATLKPKLNADLGKNRIAMIEIVAEILTPADPNTAPMIIGTPVDGVTPGATQTITFASLGSKSKATDSPITLAATSTSGLPITYQSTDPTKVSIVGNIATLVATGTASIIATQQGNAIYAAAPPVVSAITVTA